MTRSRRMLVTSALPYANGSIHLGHLVEYIQTDIWVRFQRSRGHEVHYVCATDAHGTPTMLRARELGITPEELVEKVRREHERDLRSFGVDFDNFYSTHSPETEHYVHDIYRKLSERGHIECRAVNQAYDSVENMFLPDRFVRGTCPHCGATDQPGDACENCGRVNTPKDLLEPVSVLSGSTPVYKDSEHFFFRLGEFEAFLRDWIATAPLDESVRNKLQEWFAKGLADWDISRDAPYFGFKIPETTDKYFYVWLDAPVGYFGSFAQYAARTGLDVGHFLDAESGCELYHFIGKDIVYFHALFWPAVLHGAGYRPPTAVFAHGFLTVNGEKMSKTRGTFINGATYRDRLDPTYLRYYYATKLSAGIDDIDLNLDDFVSRVNSDLVGKFVNIASRSAGFLTKHFDSELAGELHDAPLYQRFVDAIEPLAELYENREFAKAQRRIMALADEANQYVDTHKPWTLLKDADRKADVQLIATQALNMFRALAIFLSPVLPDVADKARALFAENSWTWTSGATPLLSTQINAFEPLLTRLDNKVVDEVVAASAESLPSAAPAPTNAPENPMDTATIGIDTFRQVDMRVARIASAAFVDGADKLLRLTLDLGPLGERQVFAGIRQHYAPEQLVGKLTVCVANLAPRKMRFGVSEGMVLAASDDDGVFLLSPDSGATPGTAVS
ncbi:MAG: methionine--tRNA ligase [Pseudomonadota bacterium]